jgi:mannose-6-phosphate isomerase-like protein (cupin superfamily)
MRTFAVSLIVLGLAGTQIGAQQVKGFGMWSPADLKLRQAVLHQKLRPDHSARETLGDYGSYRIRLIHRAATGAPEFHAHFADLWIIESGHGAVLVGGTLVDRRAMSGEESLAGDMTGTSIKGGERRKVTAGDVVHIPPNTPHQAVVPTGGKITYIRVAIPSD